MDGREGRENVEGRGGREKVGEEGERRCTGEKGGEGERHNPFNSLLYLYYIYIVVLHILEERSGSGREKGVGGRRWKGEKEGRRWKGEEGGSR